MRSIILIAAFCVLAPAAGWAETATVSSGQKTKIAQHSRFDAQCRAARVDIKVLQAAVNGTVSSETIDYLIAAQTKDGVKHPAQCVGKTIKGVAVFY